MRFLEFKVGITAYVSLDIMTMEVMNNVWNVNLEPLVLVEPLNALHVKKGNIKTSLAKHLVFNFQL